MTTGQASGSDADSTAANQPGQLTPEQQRRVAAAITAEATRGIVAGACCAFLFGVILWSGSRSYHSKLGLPEDLLFGGLTVLSLLVTAAFFLRRARALQEVRAGLLQRADGHIVWQAGAYRAQVPGHSLNLSAFNLPAGTYRFSFLPRSGRVIAANLVARDAPAQAHDELRHALAVANHFYLDDLPAYREGRLAQSAARHLRRIWAPAAAMLLVGLVLLVVFVVLVSGDARNDFAPLVFVFGALAGISGVFTALSAVRPTLDLLGGKVGMSEGMLQKTTRTTYGRGASTTYYYKLDGQVWTVTPEAYRALIQGPAYRVYFLPRSKRLMGIEPV